MKRTQMAIFLLCAIFLFYSCDLPSKPGNKDSEGGIGGNVEEGPNSLFVKDENKVIVEINDRKYMRPQGVTLWTTPFKAGKEFEPVSARLVKSSGYRQAGYGLVFCRSKLPEQGDCMFSVLINVNGEYAIGKIVDGNYKNILWWQSTLKLEKNYSQSNTLKISKSSDEEGELFILEINGEKECTFRDTSEPRLRNGESGYAVVISPHEIFPLNSVRVVFEKQP